MAYIIIIAWLIALTAEAIWRRIMTQSEASALLDTTLQKAKDAHARSDAAIAAGDLHLDIIDKNNAVDAELDSISPPPPPSA